MVMMDRRHYRADLGKAPFSRVEPHPPPLPAGSSCSEDPPGKPMNGIRHWAGSHQHGSHAEYNCGPFGVFDGDDGGVARHEIISTCLWEGVWDIIEIPGCRGN